jgi:hypothetical protein
MRIVHNRAGPDCQWFSGFNAIGGLSGRLCPCVILDTYWLPMYRTGSFSKGEIMRRKSDASVDEDVIEKEKHAAYKAMADDIAREAEALELAEGALDDTDDETGCGVLSCQKSEQ